MSLFIARIAPDVREDDLRNLFSRYGRLKRAEIRRTFAFVSFEDDRDADEAMKGLQGHELCGSRICIEWTKESPRYEDSRRDMRCYQCGKEGHMARNCPERVGYSRPRSRSPDRRSRDDRDRRDRSRSRERSRRARSRSPRSRSPRDRSHERSHDRHESPRRSHHSRSRSPADRRSRSPAPEPTREKSPAPAPSS